MWSVNLGDHARVLGDGSASLSFAQALSVAEALANLQAWSLTTEEKWQDKFETFVDRLALFSAILPMMEAGLARAKQAFPDAFGQMDEKKMIGMFTPETMTKFHDTYKSWFPATLVHGDCWANNIMFNKLPDGSMGDNIVAFIDWQMPLVVSVICMYTLP